MLLFFLSSNKQTKPFESTSLDIALTLCSSLKHTTTLKSCPDFLSSSPLILPYAHSGFPPSTPLDSRLSRSPVASMLLKPAANSQLDLWAASEPLLTLNSSSLAARPGRWPVTLLTPHRGSLSPSSCGCSSSTGPGLVLCLHSFPRWSLPAPRLLIPPVA